MKRTWGSPGSANGQFHNNIGIGYGENGHVYVADGRNERVQEFLPDGTFVRVIGEGGVEPGQFNLPEDVEQADGSVYVSDCYNGRVHEFDAPTGELVDWVGSRGSGDGQLDCPEGMAVASDGRIYVADTFNDRIAVLNHGSQGGLEIERYFGSSGNGPGELDTPGDLALHSSGDLYVLSSDPHTCDDSRVQRFRSNGTFVSQFGSTEPGPGQIACPNGVGIDPAGNVVVADATSEVKMFTDDGRFVQQLAGPGSGPGEVRMPFGIDFDSNCNIYISDRDNARIQVLGQDSAPLCRTGTPPSTPPPSTPPSDEHVPPLVRNVGAPPFAAKMMLRRATIRSDGSLDVLARISRRAEGRVGVRFRAAGRTVTGFFPVDTEKGYVKLRAMLPASMRRAMRRHGIATGIIELLYRGNDEVRHQYIRSRAANQRARLELLGARIRDGRLLAGGRVSSRARGVVRLTLSYLDNRGEPQEASTAVRIKDGRWLGGADLPRGAHDGGYLNVEFTGYMNARGGPMRGELLAKEVVGQ